MIPGKCPYCRKGKLVEHRVSRRGGGDMLDAQGANIKTKCGDCGRFIGYRPAQVNPLTSARPLGTEERVMKPPRGRLQGK